MTQTCRTSRQYVCTAPCVWAQSIRALAGKAKRLCRGLLGLGRVAHSRCWAAWPCRKNLGSRRLSLARHCAPGWENNSISCSGSGTSAVSRTVPSPQVRPAERPEGRPRPCWLFAGCAAAAAVELLRRGAPAVTLGARVPLSLQPSGPPGFWSGI